MDPPVVAYVFGVRQGTPLALDLIICLTQQR